MEQKAIWDYYQGEAENSFSGATPRLRFLVQVAAKLSSLSQGAKILNIGVGGGQLEQIAAQHRFIPHSIDPSEIAIEKIKQNGFTGTVSGIDAIPYENEYFDFVFCSEVLEHLEANTLHQGVSEINRVLKRKSYLIGTVPYSELLDANKIICPHCANEFHRWGHVQSFNKPAMQELLKQHGFEIIKLETRSFTAYKMDSLLSIVRGLGSKVLARLGVAMATPNLFFVARKI